MSKRNWICPVCNGSATISNEDEDSGTLSLLCSKAEGETGVYVGAHLIRCPSPKCRDFNLVVYAHYGTSAKKRGGMGGLVVNADKATPVGIGVFRFAPTVPTLLSEHVPKSIIEDYNEAWLIKDLSPKASATLCRRALQGMIRDFWRIKRKTLHLEIEALKTKIDKKFYEAIRAVKGVGNIGAHSEKNINVIIDIEPGEAVALLKLIPLLDKEWYVARATTENTLKEITTINEKKQVQKKSGV